MHADFRAITSPENGPANSHIPGLEHLPGPKGLPFFGNLFELDPGRLHLVLEDWARTHGPLYAFRAGPKRTVVVADPRLVDQILRARPDDYRRIGRIETVLDELKMPGVFSAEGSAWRPQRRLMMQALSARRLATFYPTLLRVLQRLHRRWQALADTGAVLDVVDEFKRLTVDVTTLLAFGHDVNTIEHDHDSLQKHLEVIFPAINRRLTAAFPYWRFCRMPADRRTDRSIREIRARLRQIIAEARGRIERDPQLRQSPTNLLEAMLLATDEAGQPFSDELILGNALQVLVAGEDTTAATLAWAVHLLCDHPAAVASLREELKLVLGESQLPADVEIAGRLSRVDATLLETQRLRSVAPLIFLESKTDVAMNGVTVPSGTWIILLTRLAAMSSHRPREFLPERWLEREQEADEAGRRASLPFGGGGRVCPGRALALLEMRLALAVLYGSFDVERVGPTNGVGERYAFIVEPVALQVKLRRL